MMDVEIKKIQKALYLKDAKLFREFQKNFPAQPYVDKFGEWGHWTIKVYCSHDDSPPGIYCYYINMIGGPYDASFKDFWYRWNKFNNLKAFL